ncbi:MAG: hypothetical protein ACXVFV_09315 [Mycobacteriales bacterium]
MTDQELAPAERRAQLAPAAVPLRRPRPEVGLAAPPALPAAAPEAPVPAPAAPQRGIAAGLVLVVLLLTAAAGQGAAALVLPAHSTAVAVAAGVAAGLVVLLGGLLAVRRTFRAR